MTTHHPGRDYSNYTADDLKTAAQRISTDLARGASMANLRPEGVQEQQDLRTWMLREAQRRS